MYWAFFSIFHTKILYFILHCIIQNNTFWCGIISTRKRMLVGNYGVTKVLPSKTGAASFSLLSSLLWIYWREKCFNCVKSVRIRSYSGPHFPRIRTEYGEIWSMLWLVLTIERSNCFKPWLSESNWFVSVKPKLLFIMLTQKPKNRILPFTLF